MVFFELEVSHFDLWTPHSPSAGNARSHDVLHQARLGGWPALWISLPVRLTVAGFFAPHTLQLAARCESVAVINAPSYPYKSCASDRDQYIVEYSGDNSGDREFKAEAVVSRPKIIATQWQTCRDQVREGCSWVMDLWLPLPRNLFAKRDTRLFVIEAGVKTEHHDVSFQKFVTVSLLTRERDMDLK
ncbi:hypothetical protein R3P38DRAFT_2941968 [Favolaschia claudopus]|uniref:Uncharacterized protein n=1 Tax=Favolaschia claudopus TaxID=2862362 RepID=A0AAW0BLZ2_9AGAR